MKMKWSEMAWEAALPTYEKILEQPFIQELSNGTLPREVFDFYLIQDDLYLLEYGRVLAGIASRLDNKDFAEAFLHFTKDTMDVERGMHETFLKGVAKATEPSPTCRLYTSFLLNSLYTKPIEVAVAAVLPCFWVYQKVGEHILSISSVENNPYKEWINTYGGEEFDNSAKLALSIGDELAAHCTEEQRKAMTEAYVMCTRMEWLFWQSAYEMEKWRI